MTLAILADVELHLGRPLTSSETAKVEAQLNEASDLVIGYTRQDFEPAPYPGAVTRVVAGMVGRSFDQSSVTPGIDQISTGPFSTHFTAAATSGDVWISASDKIKLRPYRRSVTSVQLYGERYTAPGAV